MVSKEEYELINAKPYFGIFLGDTIILNHEVTFSQNDPKFCEVLGKLKNCRSFEDDLEIRHEQIIYRPPYYAGPLTQNSIIARKYLLWGRAFKVMKFCKKGIKRYKKIMVNGHRKLKRIA